MRLKLLTIIGILFLIPLMSAAHSLPSDLVDSDTSLFEGFGDWANSVTFGFFWTGMLLCFCIVLYVASSRYGGTRAFAYAGVSGMFGAMLLITIGWIPWIYGSAFIIVGAISLVVLYYKG